MLYLANINLAKIQQMKLSCSSSPGHRYTVPAGETFCGLRVTCIQLFSSHSAPTSVPGKQSHLHDPDLSPQPGEGALFSPTVSSSEAQRCQAARPHHPAREEHSRISPSVTPSPVLPHCSPPAPVPPKVPPTKMKNDIFLFLRHIWNGGQTSSYMSTRVNSAPGNSVLPSVGRSSF